MQGGKKHATWCVTKAPAKRSQHTNATYRNIIGATRCVRLATLLRHASTCWVSLAQIWPCSNLSQQHPTCRNTVAKGTQHVAPNNVAICCFGIVAINCNLTDDNWIISKTLSFNPDSTFIASSAYYGPSSCGEISKISANLKNELRTYDLQFFYCKANYTNTVTRPVVVKITLYNTLYSLGATEHGRNVSLVYQISQFLAVYLLFAFLSH